MSSGLPDWHDRLEHRQHRLQAGELLLVQEDVGVLEIGHHLLGVGDEVGREIAAVELHALDDLDLGVERLGLLDRDHAFIADLLHRLGDHLADLGVAVRRDGADLGHFSGRADLLRALLDVLHHGRDRDVDAALEVHRVHAGGDRLGAFLHDRLGQHGRGGGAVAGGVVGLLGDLAHHLGAHVLELVLELDLLRHRHAVLGDARAPKLLSSTTLRPLGPSVTFTALARMSTPRSILSRASPPNRTSFAAISVCSWCLLGRQTVRFRHRLRTVA
jgi:hypothetical protein